jgi:hypothetical protein
MPKKEVISRGRDYALRVRVFDSFGKDGFHIKIKTS